MSLAIALAAGYLCGSMPFGYWLVRLTKHVDIRTLGSGNIGATNVWRVFGRRYGLPVVVLDTLKGFVPAFVATLWVGHLTGVVAGGGAMLGHARPLFLKFERGGKMVATAGGAFLGIAPLVGACAGVVWIVVFLLCRYASVASLTAAASLPVSAVLLGEPWPVIVLGVVAAVGVLYLHRANLRRLRAGTEHRASLRRRSPAAP